MIFNSTAMLDGTSSLFSGWSYHLTKQLPCYVVVQFVISICWSRQPRMRLKKQIVVNMQCCCVERSGWCGVCWSLQNPAWATDKAPIGSKQNIWYGGAEFLLDNYPGLPVTPFIAAHLMGVILKRCDYQVVCSFDPCILQLCISWYADLDLCEDCGPAYQQDAALFSVPRELLHSTSQGNWILGTWDGQGLFQLWLAPGVDILSIHTTWLYTFRQLSCCTSTCAVDMCCIVVVISEDTICIAVVALINTRRTRSWSAEPY